MSLSIIATSRHTTLNGPQKFFKPEAIFIDWDGTIVSTDNIIIKSSELLLNQYPLHGEQLANFQEFTDKKHFGMTLQQGLVIFFNQYDIGQVIKAYINIYDDLLKNEGMRIIAGALDFLKLVQHNNIKMALVTNKKSVSVFPELRSTDLYQYFSTVTSSDMVANPKPHPDPIYHARENLDPSLNLDKCWFIGDTVSDVEAATSAGCHPFFVDNVANLEQKHHEMIKEGTLTKIENYHQLSEIFIYLCQNS